jgi:regulator of CtrA degradation
MTTATISEVSPNALNLIDRTFDEGVELTLEVRNYIAYHEQADRRTMDLPACLQVGYQHTRVSARLIQIMTWLLALKAYHLGEISEEEFESNQFTLGGGDECTSPAGADASELPPGLRNLLERSHSLYMRIKRLDEMVRAKASGQEKPAAFGGLHLISSN